MDEARYGIEVARLIFKDNNIFDVRSDGVWTAGTHLQSFPVDSDAHWTPACELNGPMSPDPLSTPGLRTPFNARELAAYLVGGPGAWVAEEFGELEGELDREAMRRFGPRGTKAIEALAAAFAAYQRARRTVGGPPVALERNADAAHQALMDANQVANKQVDLYAPNITDEERRSRRARARELVEAQEREAKHLGAAADDQRKQWRSAMVRELLAPSVPISLSVALQPRTLIPFSALPDLIYDAYNPDGDATEGVGRHIDTEAIEKRLRSLAESGVLKLFLRGSGVPAEFIRGAAIRQTVARSDQLREVLIAEWGWIPCETSPGYAEPNPVSVDLGHTLGDAVQSDDFNSSVLATREQLIEAFGVFTGMDSSWFKNLKDSPKLEAARKVVGNGPNGSRSVPLFCPYEVMVWLIDKKRKKGKKISEHTAWRRFRDCFPRRYAQFEAMDPRNDDQG